MRNDNKNKIRYITATSDEYINKSRLVAGAQTVQSAISAMSAIHAQIVQIANIATIAKIAILKIKQLEARQFE